MKTSCCLLTMLLFCQIIFAQSTDAKTLTFGNQIFLENKNAGDIAWQEDFSTKPTALWKPAKYEHYKAVESKMEAFKQLGTLAVPSTGNNYDVKYYRLELRINPDSTTAKYIRGKVTTYFTTKQANFSVAIFDMATALVCDSAYYHGVKLAAGNIDEATADLLKITIPTIATIGTLDSVSVWYRGVPPTVAAWTSTGFVKSTHNAGTKNYIYTLSEPYSSYTWWPCKSYIVNDKADSMDMVVSTPINFKVAGNGSLVSEVTIGANMLTTWKERYPIAAYQVCTAVANYVQYPAVADTVLIGATKMPVYNYLFPETNTTAAHTSLDGVKTMLTTFSTLFGDYPFKKEKYGNYTFGFGGGMEHNTFSGESAGVYDQVTDWDILAHELGHQWWGDNVTCNSWQDIWLNESFADYSEVLCAEFAPSVSAAAGNTGLSWRQNKKTQVMNTGNQAQSTHVTDTSTILTIFTPAVYIYERGGMIISMLRTLMGDAKFFQALKNYQSDPLLKLGGGLTADMKAHMEAASGLNLTTFFNQWIYNTGFANYNLAKWNNSGKQIVLQLPQTTQFSALTHFDMPLAVRIQGAAGVGDTTVIVYDENGVINYDNNGVLSSTGGNIVQYTLSFVPVTITFDAYSQVIATGTFTKNSGLGVLATNIINFSGNNGRDNVKLWWGIDKATDYALFEIEKSNDGVSFEKIGTIKSTENTGKYNFSFTDQSTSAATAYYRIKVVQKNGVVIYTKTIAISNTAGYELYTITPNPAADYILVNGIATEKADIKIYDGSGKVVKKLLKQTLTAGNGLRISVNDLCAGNYFVEIQSVNSGRHTRQIVIVK